ncbi:hypothetical protein H2201_005126 [Coniosporium apollinis]|uniref:Uncharacterized protein n=1 Tax=Coniosporium apollinis TaxID=61459 RepID=A0ABQ9NQV2_9PEZI|nr:hypothetical protein H2201_005126 [Coniosporium apollinis]
MGDIPLLLLSRRFFKVGLRALVTHETFTFVMQKFDSTFHIAWLPPAVGALPSTRNLELEIFPERSAFYQTEGVLALGPYSRSLLKVIPDPVALIQKVRICIYLPLVRIHRLWSDHAAAAAAEGTVNAKLTHFFLPHDATATDVLSWMEPELTHAKAEYHLGTLKELPLKNLKLLELDFSSFTYNRVEPDCDKAVARWIGRYLQGIDVVRMAKTVRVIAAEPGWTKTIQDAMVNGLKLWVGNL